MARVLVHACCGPCAIYPLSRLLDQGLEPVVLYHNPNIHPLTEYLRRREGLFRVAERMGVKAIYKDDEYRPGDWIRAVSHREANRCFHCYHIRLERTASIAKRGRFDFFTTTLLYSKFQKHDEIASLGRDLAGGGATRFLYEDYRQGWDEGIGLSKEWGIYRQQYCGCLLSENERYARLLKTEPGSMAEDAG